MLNFIISLYGNSKASNLIWCIWNWSDKLSVRNLSWKSNQARPPIKKGLHHIMKPYFWNHLNKHHLYMIGETWWQICFDCALSSSLPLSLVSWWVVYLSAMPASPSVSWPPATASRSGTSRRLPLRLQTHREVSTHSSGEQEMQHGLAGHTFVGFVCATSRLTGRKRLPGAGWTSGAEVKQREAEEEEDWEAQAYHDCGSSRTGHRVSPCAAVEGTKHTRGGWIYSGPLCTSLATQHALAPEICFCPNIRKRWERWKGGAVNNEPPVSGFEKYLLGTSCTEQY